LEGETQMVGNVIIFFSYNIYYAGILESRCALGSSAS